MSLEEEVEVQEFAFMVEREVDSTNQDWVGMKAWEDDVTTSPATRDANNNNKADLLPESILYHRIRRTHVHEIGVMQTGENTNF